MLRGCSSLLSLPDISKWNTNNVSLMSKIFNAYYYHIYLILIKYIKQNLYLIYLERLKYL